MNVKKISIIVPGAEADVSFQIALLKDGAVVGGGLARFNIALPAGESVIAEPNVEADAIEFAVQGFLSSGPQSTFMNPGPTIVLNGTQKITVEVSRPNIWQVVRGTFPTQQNLLPILIGVGVGLVAGGALKK